MVSGSRVTADPSVPAYASQVPVGFFLAIFNRLPAM
jgi:hypothetical protein